MSLTIDINRSPKATSEPEPPYVDDKGSAQTELNQQQTWFGEDRVGFTPNPEEKA